MSWASIFPLILQVLSFVLQRVNASNTTIQKFKDLIESSQNDGLISQQASDKFKSIHEKLMDQFKGDQNAKSPTRPS